MSKTLEQCQVAFHSTCLYGTVRDGVVGSPVFVLLPGTALVLSTPAQRSSTASRGLLAAQPTRPGGGSARTRGAHAHGPGERARAKTEYLQSLQGQRCLNYFLVTLDQILITTNKTNVPYEKDVCNI